MLKLSYRLAAISTAMIASLAWAATAAAQDPAAPAPAPAAAAPAQPISSGPVEEVKHDGDKSDNPSENSIYAEGLGAAIAYSINYERMVIPELGVRVGFSYLSIGASATAGGTTSSESASYLFFPITASYTGIRSGKSALELGAGATILYVTAAANGAGVAANGAGVVPFGVAMVGYRLQPIGGKAGFMFRVGVEALIAKGLGLSNPDPGSIGFLPWPYISFGASF
jgi:hypothetical protein